QKHQRNFEYVVCRQYGLWWRDFEGFYKQVESAGIRAWIWSDYVWEHPDLFWERMPRSILQSNWYYGESFADETRVEVRTYKELEDHKYDQVPTLSNWEGPQNITGTFDFCRKHINPDRLKGFLLAPWRPTLPETRERHLEAIEVMGKAIAEMH